MFAVRLCNPNKGCTGQKVGRKLMEVVVTQPGDRTRQKTGKNMRVLDKV